MISRAGRPVPDFTRDFHFHRLRHIGHQPADRLPPGFLQIAGAAASSRRRSHRHRSPTSSAAARPRPNGCTTSAGRAAPPAVSTSASTEAPGLIASTRLSERKPGIATSRVSSSCSFARTRTHGCSQPSRVSFRCNGCVFTSAGAAIEIHGQQLPDRRAGVATFAERTLAAQHQQAAAALADELLQQRQLILREERGFDVVENDRVIAIQILRHPSESRRAVRPRLPCPAAEAPAGRIARPSRRSCCRSRGTAGSSARRRD